MIWRLLQLDIKLSVVALKVGTKRKQKVKSAILKIKESKFWSEMNFFSIEIFKTLADPNKVTITSLLSDCQILILLSSAPMGSLQGQGKIIMIDVMKKSRPGWGSGESGQCGSMARQQGGMAVRLCECDKMAAWWCGSKTVWQSGSITVYRWGSRAVW